MPFDPSTIHWSDLLAPAIALVFGAVGSLGRLFRADTPREERLSVALTGAVAGVASVYLLDPETAPKFIAACVAAGYLGQAILDSFTARIKALEVTRANAALQGEVMQARAIAEKAESVEELTRLRAHVANIKVAP